MVNDQFGSYVAISGGYAVVSAIGDDVQAFDRGAAYIYDVKHR